MYMKVMCERDHVVLNMSPKERSDRAIHRASEILVFTPQMNFRPHLEGEVYSPHHASKDSFAHLAGAMANTPPRR